MELPDKKARQSAFYIFGNGDGYVIKKRYRTAQNMWWKTLNRKNWTFNKQVGMQNELIKICENSFAPTKMNVISYWKSGRYMQ